MLKGDEYFEENNTELVVNIYTKLKRISLGTFRINLVLMYLLISCS